MHLAFDIFQGIGIAIALGIRPFLPALAAGLLALGSVEIHFSHTSYSFLQSAPFLIAMAVCAVVLLVLERRRGDPAASATTATPGATRRSPVMVALGVIGAALGALLFAGSLARGHYAAWPGWIGGVICAALAVLAAVPLLARVRARMDRDVAATLPIYIEVLAVLLAVLAVVAPPLGVVWLILVVWLLAGGRRREGQKYAGLRILR